MPPAQNTRHEPSIARADEACIIRFAFNTINNINYICF